MNARYLFYLDGTLVNEPKGWDSFSQIIDRKQDIPETILEDMEGTFEFYGEAYQHFSNLKAEGFCGSASMLVEEDCTQSGDYKQVFRGTVFVSDIKFNRTKCTARVSLSDDSFRSFINNNKGIEVAINVGNTKNGEDLDDIDIYEVGMFDPCTGSAISGRKATAYTANDIGSYLIAYITDNRVGFRSSALAPGGEWAGLMISSGVLIRNDGTGERRLTMTLTDYLEEVSKKIPLGYYIDSSGGSPVFVLEKRSDLYGTQTLITCTDVDEVIEENDPSRNYSSVSFGSGQIIESNGCAVPNEPAFPDQIDFIGCKEEEFHTEGQCNVASATLDLSGDWVVSSNVIEQVFTSYASDYDGEVFFLHTENLDTVNLTADAVQTDVFNLGTPVVYNGALFNDQVAVRHIGGIPNTLVKYFTRPDSRFKAYWTNTETITIPAVTTALGTELYPYPFGQDYLVGSAQGIDLNNDYGNGTAQGTLITQVNSRYTAPFPGAFTFRVILGKVNVTNPGNLSVVVITFRHRDSGGTLIQEDAHPHLFANGGLHSLIKDSKPIFMNPGDYVDVSITNRIFSTIIHDPLRPSTFELIAVNASGGVFQFYDPNEFINQLYRFRYPMSRTDFETLRSNPMSKIAFTTQNFEGSGWIKSLKYYPAGSNQGIAEITLITNGN